jgi:hypothetical protein
MNFQRKRDKVIKAFTKNTFIYEVYKRYSIDTLLSFFKSDFTLDGNILLIEKWFPINVYEVYFREGIPIGCYGSFSERADYLEKFNIKLLIITDKSPELYFTKGIPKAIIAKIETLNNIVKSGKSIQDLIRKLPGNDIVDG